MADGADFDSTQFAGNMVLSSANIKTASLGSGSDTVTITGQANDPTSLYQLGAGNNTLTIGSSGTPLDLAGDVTSGDGNDTVTVNGNTIATLTARSSINVGGSDNTTGNTVTITGAHAGDVEAGNGRDAVNVGSTAAGSTISVGNGTNTVTVTAAHAGSITGGDDRDVVTAGSTIAGSTINVGGSGTDVGTGNTVTINAGHAGSIAAGDGRDDVTITGNVAATASISVGGGVNTVSITGNNAGTITGGNDQNTVTVSGAHLGAITGGTGVDTVTVGSTATGSTITLQDGLNTVTMNGAHAGAITGGDDRDVVTVGSMSAGSSILTFDGTDSVTVNGNMTDATIDVGGGDGNTVTVTGNVTSGPVPASILFGDGAGNALTIRGSLIGGDVTFGDGENNTFSIAGAVNNGATITMGSGSNTPGTGSSIGNFTTASPLVFSSTGTGNELIPDTATVIRMGDGNDQLTLNSAGTSALNISTPASGMFLVESGGFIHGEGGANDTLIVRTQQDNDTNVIGRTISQKVEIELFNADVDSYRPGDVITVSFGGVIPAVTYAVVDLDIVQGNGARTSENIAVKVAAALNGNTAFQNVFGAAAIDGTAATGNTHTTSVYITSDVALADVVITAAHGATDVPVTVMQISDTRITGFENVNLVIENDASLDANDVPTAPSLAATVMQADFALINSETPLNILLDSQVQLGTTVETFPAGTNETLDNGAYTKNYAVGAQTFDLDNLQGGEQITVRGHETTATGNQQVNRINIDDREGPTAGHQLGDEIVVTIGNVRMVYEVVAEDLADGVSQSVDADRIGAKLVEMINARTGETTVDGVVLPGHGFTAVLDVESRVESETDNAVSPDNFGNYAANSFNTGAWVTLTGAADLPPATVNVAHTRTNVATTDTGAGNITVLGDTPSGTQTEWNIGAALAAGSPNTLLAGDVITVTRVAQGDVPAGTASYTVTAEDCLRLNADMIAADLAQQLGGGAAANFGVIDFGTGSAVADLVITRTTEVPVSGSQTALSGGNNPLQVMTATDDGVADVIIDATLVATADDRTMDLTIDGYGNFDLSIVGNAGNTGFRDLSMTLADGFDHTIDLNGGTYSGTTASVGGIVGNFSNSLTVVDEDGRSTEDQNIVLSEVLSRTVNTSAADANFTIDQYTGVRTTAANFTGEVITVTTGSFNDHLRTLAQSALTENQAGDKLSSINLGTGTNRLSLNWGTGATVNSALLTALGGMAYAGDLDRLDIESFVDLDAPVTILGMPGGVTDVNTLTFTDLESASGAVDSLIIRGAANNFRIETGDDFEIGASGDIGTLTVEGAANQQINGALTVVAGDDVLFNVGNTALDALTVTTLTAGDNVNIGYAGLGAATGDREEILLGSLNLSAGGNADFRVEGNQRTDFTISTDLTVRSSAGGNATFTVDNNMLSTLSVGGNVEVSSTTANASLNLGDGVDNGTVGNQASTISVAGGIDLQAGNVASLTVNGNTFLDTATARTDSNVTVNGNIVIEGQGAGSSGTAALLEVSGNTRTNVSLADNGTIELVACGNDDDTRVIVSNNLNNFLPEFGNPDQAVVTNRSYAINLGAIQADAGRDAVVSLTDNDDDTYYGDLSVTIDSVDLFAYRNAELTIGGAGASGNNSATIVIGDVNMASQEDGTLAVINNDGRIYVVTEPAFGTRRELDFADITIGNVTIDADAGNVTDTANRGDAVVTVADNDMALVDVGIVNVDAGGDATFRIDNNNDTAVTMRDVTIDAGTTSQDQLTFSISDNDRVDNGATTVPPLASNVTINGNVALTAGDTTVININDNDGLSATAQSTVTVNGNFTSTSGDSVTATINNNDFADIDIANTDEILSVLNLTSTGDDVYFFINNNTNSSINLGVTTLDAFEDAVMAVTDNILSDVNATAGRTTLNADDDAQFAIVGNGFGSVRFGDVQINALDDVDGSGGIGGGTVGFDIRANTGGTNVVGGNRLRDLDPANYQDLVIGDDNSNAVFYGAWLDPTTPSLAFALWGGTFDNSTRAPLDGNLIVLPYTLISGPRAGDEVFFLLSETGQSFDDDTLRNIFAAELGVSPADLLQLLSNIQTVSAPMFVETGEVDINAGGTVDARIRENRDADITVGRVDLDGDDVSLRVADNRDTVVRSGVFDVDGTGVAFFGVTDNIATAAAKDSFIELAAVVTRDGAGAITGITRNAITIDANSVGSYGASSPASWGVLVAGNDDSQVILGNLSVTASDQDVAGGNDVTLGIFATDDELIDVGNITLRADNDVWAEISNTDFGTGANVRTGDITITSGLVPEIDVDGTPGVDNPNVSSDLYFRAIALEGNDLNDNVGDNGQQITLIANSRGTGEGYIYADISNAPDLTSLTVGGGGAANHQTNAEIYLTGNIGGDSTGTTTFTLDLSGLTGGFGPNGASAYDPLGIVAVDNRDQDHGSYVETWNADFGGDIVQVRIGSGDLIYNAQHSNFGGATNDWNNAPGWFSLNGNGNPAYLAPINEKQDLTFLRTADGLNNESGSFSLQVNGVTYQLSVTEGQTAVGGQAGALLTALGQGSSIAVTANVPGGTNSSFTVRITGGNDGGDVAVTNVTAITGTNFFASFTGNTISQGRPAADGVGNVDKEVFTFTGDSVGEIVIGGFNPGAWASINPENGRLTDRLDFSQFDWNGDDIVGNDSGLVSLSDFSFTVLDNDGYFADVLIDFNGTGNQQLSAERIAELQGADFGSIRLVGVGEYNNAVTLVQESIIF